MAAEPRAAKVSARDRARWERQVPALEEAETDAELTPQQQEDLRASMNELREQI